MVSYIRLRFLKFFYDYVFNLIMEQAQMGAEGCEGLHLFMHLFIHLFMNLFMHLKHNYILRLKNYLLGCSVHSYRNNVQCYARQRFKMGGNK